MIAFMQLIHGFQKNEQPRFQWAATSEVPGERIGSLATPVNQSDPID
jgi:hypothetical protein